MVRATGQPFTSQGACVSSGEWGGLQASATTAAGTPISSNVANSPCA